MLTINLALDLLTCTAADYREEAYMRSKAAIRSLEMAHSVRD